jgi:hypothetical protein
LNPDRLKIVGHDKCDTFMYAKAYLYFCSFFLIL